MTTIALPAYNIYLEPIKEAFQDFLREKAYSRYFVIVDENTREHCLPLLVNRAPAIDWQVICIPAGEQHKQLDTCVLLWQQLMEGKANRRSLVVNLGGGVIGDMGGFCASTFKRGMDFVQMPTTLLSQVDASIGGKLGIDFMQVKNSIGLFKDPRAVFIDPVFLKTLPSRELRSGFAEIIKHSLIADEQQWHKIKQIRNLEKLNWTEYLAPSLHIKQRIVEEDPFEYGIRKALNFGHTIGHALEGFALETDRPLLHGEAIAIGMVCEAYLSHLVLGLSNADLQSINDFILQIYDAYPLNPADFDTFIRLMQQDKKNRGEEINFSLIRKPGQAVVDQVCSPGQIVESLVHYNHLLSVFKR